MEQIPIQELDLEDLHVLTAGKDAAPELRKYRRAAEVSLTAWIFGLKMLCQAVQGKMHHQIWLSLHVELAE